MGYKRVEFNEKGFDEIKYKKYFSQNQAEYIRRKLRSVKLYNEGIEFEGISKILLISELSVRKYVGQYLMGGFEVLCQKVKRPQSSLLTSAQSLEFREVLLSTRPSDFGLISTRSIVLCMACCNRWPTIS